MPSAQNIIITNNIISSCTPINIEVWCKNNNGILQHHLSFGQDPIIFKRNNVDKIDYVTFTIDRPAYLGCNKLELCNSQYFPQGTGKVLNNATFKLTDIHPGGNTGNFVVFDNTVQAEVKCNKYSYQIVWDFENDLDLSSATGGDGYTGFIGCNMALELVQLNTNGSTKASKEDVEISNPNIGFPLCDGFLEQCFVLCGKLTIYNNKNNKNNKCNDESKDDNIVCYYDVDRGRITVFSKVPPYTVETYDISEYDICKCGDLVIN